MMQSFQRKHGIFFVILPLFVGMSCSLGDPYTRQTDGFEAQPTLADDNRGGLKLLRPEIFHDVLKNSFQYTWYTYQDSLVDFTYTSSTSFKQYLGGLDYDGFVTRPENIPSISPVVLRRFAFEYCDLIFKTQGDSWKPLYSVLADSKYDYDTGSTCTAIGDAACSDDYNTSYECKDAGSGCSGNSCSYGGSCLYPHNTLIPTSALHYYNAGNQQLAIEHYLDRMYKMFRSRPITEASATSALVDENGNATTVQQSAYDLFQEVENLGRCKDELDAIVGDCSSYGSTYDEALYTGPSCITQLNLNDSSVQSAAPNCANYFDDGLAAGSSATGTWNTNTDDLNSDGIYDFLESTDGYGPWKSVCSYFLLIEGSFAVY